MAFVLHVNRFLSRASAPAAALGAANVTVVQISTETNDGTPEVLTDGRCSISLLWLVGAASRSRNLSRRWRSLFDASRQQKIGRVRFTLRLARYGLLTQSHADNSGHVGLGAEYVHWNAQALAHITHDSDNGYVG